MLETFNVTYIHVAMCHHAAGHGLLLLDPLRGSEMNRAELF